MRGRGRQGQGSNCGQSASSNSANQEKSLPVTSIRVKTDVPKEAFSIHSNPDNDSSNKLTRANNPAGVFSSIISYNQLDTDGYHDNDVNHSTETTKGNNFSHRRGRARSRT